MSKSYQPPDKSTYDPGWNDPPPMATNQLPPTNKSRLNLNKRVAFPLQSSPSAAAQIGPTGSGLPLSVSNTPPNPNLSGFRPPPLSSVPPSHQPPASGQIFVPPPPPALNEVQQATPQVLQTSLPQTVPSLNADAKDICQRVFSNVLRSTPTPLDAAKHSELEKRLDILFNMWSDDKLNKDTHQRLHDIAKSLEDNNIESAAEQHRLLILNQSAVCAQWGTALRHLILLNETDDPTFQTPVDNSTPTLLNVNTLPIPEKKPTSSRFGPIQHL